MRTVEFYCKFNSEAKSTRDCKSSLLYIMHNAMHGLSQGSAVAHGTVINVVFCLKGKCVFRPLGLEKPINILEPNLTGVITSVRYTNSPHVVQIGCEMAPPQVVKYNGFVIFFSHLYSFFPFLRPAHRSQFWSELYA